MNQDHLQDKINKHQSSHSNSFQPESNDEKNGIEVKENLESKHGNERLEIKSNAEKKQTKISDLPQFARDFLVFPVVFPEDGSYWSLSKHKVAFQLEDNINTVHKKGITPLFLAYDKNRNDVLNVLLNCEDILIDQYIPYPNNTLVPDWHSLYGLSLLALTIKHLKGKDLFDKLIQRGADVNFVCKYGEWEGFTLLYLTAKGLSSQFNEIDNQFQYIFHKLLELGVDINIQNGSLSSLCYAQELNEQYGFGGKPLEVCEKRKDHSSETILFAQVYNEVLIRKLINLGANIDIPSNKNETPIHLISHALFDRYNWHPSFQSSLKEWIKNGVKIDLRNNKGFTALELGKQILPLEGYKSSLDTPEEYKEKCDLLLNRQQEVVTILESAEKLFLVAETNNIKEANELVRLGASFNQRNKAGMTPFWISILAGQTEMAKHLLAQQNKDWFRIGDKKNLVEILCRREIVSKKCPNLSLSNAQGLTALDIAVKHKNGPVILLLMDVIQMEINRRLFALRQHFDNLSKDIEDYCLFRMVSGPFATTPDAQYLVTQAIHKFKKSKEIPKALARVQTALNGFVQTNTNQTLQITFSKYFSIGNYNRKDVHSRVIPSLLTPAKNCL